MPAPSLFELLTFLRMCAASATDGHAVDPPSENTEDEDGEEDPDIAHTTTDEGEDDFPPAVSYAVSAYSASSSNGS